MKPDPAPHAAGGDGGNACFRFDGIVVDAAAHTLVRDGQVQALEPKAFAVLLALLRRPGELLGRDDLLDQVWGHRHVTPGVLTRAIAQLRAALDDDSHRPRYIQTQHALGYRFVGKLQEAEQEVAPAAAAEPAIAAAPAASGHEPAAAPVAATTQAFTPPTDDGEPEPAFVPPADEVEPAPDPEPHRDERPPVAAWKSWAAGLAFAALLAAGAWWWRSDGPAAIPAEASIAVLPFTTLSDTRDDRYFAEGLSMEMLNALAGVHGLKVAAWRPPEAIDRSQDVRALGRLLGVATVLDAGVRRDGHRLRISARLSDTRSGYTLWSRNYEGDADTIFDTQTDIADAVVDALVSVLPGERESLRKRLTPTRDAMAFDAYLLGLKQAVHPQGEDAAADATRHFRIALEADAGFARAQAGLCRMEAWNFESNRNTAAFESARLACLRAMNMDGSLGEVNLAMGDLYRVQGDARRALEYYGKIVGEPALRWKALVGRARVHVDQGQEAQAMEDFRQALAASPGNAEVHAMLGYELYRLGHYRDAIASFRTVVALRPDDAQYWTIYGGLLQSVGDDVASEAALRRSLALEPGEAALSNLGTLLYRKGDYAGAAALYRRAAELNPGDFFYPGYLGAALDADPRTAGQARAAYEHAAELAQAFVDVKPDDAMALATLGWYRAWLGDADNALRLAQQALALGQEPGEVALLNAQTYAELGRNDQARAALQAARAAGIPEVRIAAEPLFRRAGLATPPAPAGHAPGPTPASVAAPGGA